MSILDDYLSGGPVRLPGGGAHHSCLAAAVRDARRITGRDEATGDVVRGGETGTWLGLVGYLTVLDQLGSAVASDKKLRFNGESSRSTVTGRFLRTLDQFSTIDLEDAQAIWALRNSLVHDFSLTCVQASDFDDQGQLRGNRRPYVRAFALTRGGGRLVNHPRVSWDGKYPVQTPPTTVDIEAVGDLVEHVISQVLLAHDAGRLVANIGEAEFADRYFMTVR